jgi:protein SCO1
MTEGTMVGSTPASSRTLPVERGPVTWLTLAATVALGGAVVYQFKAEKDARVQKLREEGAMGKASIGGPFELVSHDGRAFRSEELKGQFALVYFGFTQCPDACPEALYKMGEAVQLLEERDKALVTPVFLSIDPQRDTPEEVAAYVHDFHPRMIGLTGPAEAVKQTARKYRVYYNKVQEEGPDDYLVDHTIIQYLLDPQGDFVTFYAKNSSGEDIAASVRAAIQDYKKGHADYDPAFKVPRTDALAKRSAEAAVEATRVRRKNRGWLGWLWGKK